MKKNIFVIVLVVLLAGVAVYQNAQRANKETLMPTEQAPQVNFLAPSFTLTGLDGKSYSIGGEREKPLLVNFWASWCGPCEEEAPDLVNVYNKYQGQFDLYAVNVTPGDKMDNIKKFVETHKYPFPVLLDKQGTNAETYRVVAIPTSFLIDKNGVVREVIHVLSAKELDKKIAGLIKG
ncbi:TlpA disulfide reductase family protein [Paenibacillus alba]|uniref:TlpA disulfide reductase family protein n=1 Tax=Paenibacillus alba TaxID=1197127 RepID=A0ABU6G5Q0_9BACL|nr:TlpA disulfide reductase family protein [Paenibacillus alba]MEC0228974.1 TlpA disulfide reductase family protein [Paenibacillus alba]